MALAATKRVIRKRNVPGYIDELGRFRPIRAAKFVGSGRSRRPAKLKDRKKYSRAKGGDLGKLRQERALEAPWDREHRLRTAADERAAKHEERVRREIERDAYGDADSDGPGRSLLQFVRAMGGLRKVYKFGGKKGAGKYGKRQGYDLGEIERLSYKETGKRGLTTESGGKPPDEMVRAARAEGFNVADFSDLIDKVESEAAGGSPTYATHGSLGYGIHDNPAKVYKVHAPRDPRRNKYRLGDTLCRQRGFEQDIAPNDDLGKVTCTKCQGLLSGLEIGPDNRWRKKNPDPISTFANMAVGIASAMQIHESMSKSSRKKKTPRKVARKNPAPAVRFHGFGRDANGNSTAKFSIGNGRAFSIQTNGNLPFTHRQRSSGGPVFPADVAGVEKEAAAYIAKYGSAAQRKALGLAKVNPTPKPNGTLHLRGKTYHYVGGSEPLADKATANKYVQLFKRDYPNWAPYLKALKYGDYYYIVVPQSVYDSVRVRNPKSAIQNRKSKGSLYVLTISRGDDVESIYLHDGKGDGFSKKFRSMAAAKSHATRAGKTLVTNPAKWQKFGDLKIQIPDTIKGEARKQVLADCRKMAEIWKSLNAPKSGRKAKNPKRGRGGSPSRSATLGLRKMPATFKGRARRTGSGVKRRKSTATPGRLRRITRAGNPAAAVPSRRRTFESFQGRKPTTARPLAVSIHAGSGRTMDQLGKLHELKLMSGKILKLNPKRHVLAACGGRLWIVGAPVGKPDPSQPEKVINPIDHVDHVVYETYKPHLGDPPGTQYIHKLGEEGGSLPLLCLDRDGYAVLKGGQYKITREGIRD